jgi:hypothetical protein
MSLEKEIADSIKKNLPQQVGDVLKQRLEQADKDAKKAEELSDKLIERNKEVEELEATIRDYKQFDLRNGLLDSREKELITERNSLELEKLKYQLQAEKDKTQFSQNLAMGLVRNIEYRKNILDSESSGQPVRDANGNVYYPTPTNKNHLSTDSAI